MEGLLCSKSLPPGFRFHPTDEELFMYYLKRKVLGKKLSPEMIAVVDVYQYAPWELPPMASLKSRDLNWYFFCPRARKYPNGGRANRATVYGYWKSTGNDRTMMYNSRPVGKIKTLIFHRGKAPKGERTDWVMHEYRLEDKVLAEKGVLQDLYVICKIYEKSGLGPKNGENYGARFLEEEWDSDVDNDDNRSVQEGGPEAVCVDTGHGSISGLTSIVASPNGAQSVNFPSDCVVFPDTNVIVPNISSSFVGTPVSASIQDRGPEFVAVDMGLGRVGDSPDGSISGLTSIVASPNVAQPVYFPDANVNVPNVSDSFLGTPVNASVGNPVNASMGTPSTGVSTQDEVSRMLSYFTEELDNDNDFFNDLGDLGIPSGQFDLDWSDIIEIDDLK